MDQPEMKFVCESLHSFRKLNENMEQAKKAFAEEGFDENSDKWKEFIRIFGADPEFMGKFAEWILTDKEDPLRKENLEDIERIYTEAKENKVKLDTSSFQSFTDFLRKAPRLIYSQRNIIRDELHKKELEDIAKKGNEEKDEIDQDLRIEETIDTLNLKSLKKFGARGMYLLPEVDTNLESNIQGQGLYIWVELPDLYGWKGDPKKLKIEFKFGQFGAQSEKGKTAVATILSYSGVFKRKVILYIKNLNSYVSDPKSEFKNAYQVEHEVAKVLHNNGWNRSTETKSTEIYKGGSLQELIETINKVISGSTRNNLLPKEEQKTGINKISSFFKKKGPKPQEFLLAAKMRYGKNITVLKAIKDINETENCKNCLVITYKPSVFSSLKDDLKKFSDFENFELVDISKEKNILPTSDKIRIFISSAQYALYNENKEEDVNEEEKLKESSIYELSPEQEVEQKQKIAYEDYEKNLDKIKKIHFDLIIADEYHYGTKSQKFKTLVKELDPDRIIYVSGTAMKDMATHRFNEDQIYNWTYIDEQKQKNIESEQQKEGSPGPFPHLDMPKMHFYKMELCPKAKELADKFSDAQGFSFKKLIDVDANGKLMNEELAKILLQQIIDPTSNGQQFSIKNTGVTGTNLNHTFWVFDKNTAGIKAIANLMRDMDEFKGYEIIEATGELNSNIDKVKNLIQGARKSITLTCYRFKEGTTVPEWGAAIMLDDGKSPEEYLQAIFRCQSPGRKGKDGKILKENCYVFDYNPQRLLLLYHDIAQWSSKTGEEGQTAMIKEFLNYAPVLQAGENGMVEVNADEIIENFQIHGSFSEKMANERVFNEENIDKLLTEDLIDDLVEISSKKNSTEIRINDNELAKAKNALTHKEFLNNIESDENKEENLEIQKEKIRNVLRRIPTFLFASKVDEQTVKQIIETPEAAMFKEICGVSPDFLQKLIGLKILNPVAINETILFFSRIINEVEADPTMESVEALVKKHFVMHGEESSTPKEIVNEMLDKLPKEIWNDPNKTFLDPVCGTGKFLIGIYERLMKGLEGSIKDKEERSKHIIENQIYGSDNVEHKIIMARKFLGNKPYKYNLNTENSLKRDINMEFDVVIGNPPYQGSLHFDFLKIANKISKRWIVWIHPSLWLLDKRPIPKYESLKTELKKSLKEVTLFNGNPIFNIMLKIPICILVIDKKSAEEKIHVIDKINKKDLWYHNIEDINKWSNNNEYESLVKKFDKLSGVDNLMNHLGDKSGKYFVSFSSMRGNQNNKDIDKLYKHDYYTFLDKNEKVEDQPTKDMYFSFNTQEEAQNFLNFLKTKWAMFSLSIFKVGMDLRGKVQSKVPWLDWSKEWTFDNFSKLIQATPEEIKFVKDNIPDTYYK